MKKGIMVLCHSNQEYAGRFIQYANHSSRFLLEVNAYTCMEGVASYLEKRPAEICLIEEGKLEELALLEGKIDKGRILILSASAYQSVDMEYPTVYQYQSMTSLLNQISRHYLDMLPETSGCFLSKDMDKEIITIFGLAEGTDKTAYALEAAREAGQAKRTLYVNLEAVPEALVQTQEQGSAGEGIYELLYYLAQKNGYGGLKLASLCEEWNGISRLLSPCMLENYFSMQREDIQMLVDCILKESEFEVIVFDIGMYLPFTEPIFEQSSRIVLVEGQGQDAPVHGARAAALKDCLKREGKKWLERMEMVRLTHEEGMVV